MEGTEQSPMAAGHAPGLSLASVHPECRTLRLAQRVSRMAATSCSPEALDCCCDAASSRNSPAWVFSAGPRASLYHDGQPVIWTSFSTCASIAVVTQILASGRAYALRKVSRTLRNENVIDVRVSRGTGLWLKGTQVTLDDRVGSPESQHRFGEPVRERLDPIVEPLRLFLGPLQDLQFPLELLLLLIRLVLCEKRRDSDRPDQCCRKRENANLHY